MKFCSISRSCGKLGPCTTGCTLSLRLYQSAAARYPFRNIGSRSLVTDITAAADTGFDAAVGINFNITTATYMGSSIFGDQAAAVCIAATADTDIDSISRTTETDIAAAGDGQLGCFDLVNTHADLTGTG